MIKNLTLAVDLAEKTEPASWMVVVMGVGIVFLGLVLIIFICKIMSLFFVKTVKADKEPVATAAPANNAVIQNRQEIIAAVTAACAEEMGKDVSALRVISFKKL